MAIFAQDREKIENAEFWRKSLVIYCIGPGWNVDPEDETPKSLERMSFCCCFYIFRFLKM